MLDSQFEFNALSAFRDPPLRNLQRETDSLISNVVTRKQNAELNKLLYQS